MGYDEWLERPYIEAAERGEGFERFCDDYGFDYDDPESEREYQIWQESAEEAAAEAKAERRAERDREDWDAWERRI